MSRYLRLAFGAVIALSLGAALVLGCSDDEQPQPQQQAAAEQTDQQAQPEQAQAQQSQQSQPRAVSSEPLNVVVSTQVIADWARQVGGDRVNVQALVPAGADVHTIELSVADIRAIADADLVIINGAGLEASYADAILENADNLLDLAEAIEEEGYVLAPFSAMEDEHGDEDEHDHEQDGHDEEGHGELNGRLLITDGEASHVSVLDLETEEVDSGAFEFNAPPAAIYASPNHRYAFVLARGPGDADDGIHLLDGGIFLVEHGDHFDLVREPVSRHPLVVVDERPIHFVNSYGWTAVFADAQGYVYLYEEEELTHDHDDYAPVVLDTGPQHGAALAISPEHIIVTTKNPDFPENSDDSLPVGVEVRTLDDEVVYDASNRSCPGMHGETHNEDGAIFGCIGGVLFLHPSGNSYHHDFIENPPEMREESRIGSFFGHHHSSTFFGRASYFDGQGFASDGVWLIEPESGEFRQVFSENIFGGSFGSNGEKLYLLSAEGELLVLDAHDGDELAHADILEVAEGSSPSLIVVGETMFITDPANGQVHAVDLDHLEVVESWDIGGTPSRLAYVGIVEQEDHDEHEDHGATEAIGRLLIADALEAHLSVLDLNTEEVDSGIFSVAAPGATVNASPTNRYGIVIARGPADGDDRIHIFDSGVFLVPHGDHYDLVNEPVSRHALEIVEEWPVHYVNSHGWTTIFADTNGRAILINEQDLAGSRGDYEPITLDVGYQHGAAFVIAEGHIIHSVSNPACTEFIPGTWECLPMGVEVRNFDNEVVYDAGPCPILHGEAHNAHGAVFGCGNGVLFVHAHDGEYEHELIPYPPESGAEGEFAIGLYYGHHDAENFFGPATLFPDGQCCDLGGVWLIDVVNGEMREVFPETSAAAAFSSDGETFYFLAADGVLRAVDAHDGEIVESMQLVDPFEIVFGTPTPALTVVGEMMYVADPASGHVLAVHLEEMEIEEEWEVGGAPSSLAFIGVTDSGGAPAQGHDEGDDHDDDHDEHEEDEHGHHHHHGDEDPHFWFDAELASAAIEAIADELSSLSPDAAAGFGERLDLYLGEIAEADAEVRALLDGVPENQRLLVTFHDAFGYFARRYGLEIGGFVVEGPEQGVSAGALVELIELIEHEGVETVFHEPQFDPSILDTVASETGTKRGIIWSQPTPDNPTYIGILVGNAQAIADQ